MSGLLLLLGLVALALLVLGLVGAARRHGPDCRQRRQRVVVKQASQRLDRLTRAALRQQQALLRDELRRQR